MSGQARPLSLLRHLPMEMTCREGVEVMTDFLEHRLSFPERVRFHLHLRMCLGCRAYLQQMRHTVRVLGLLPDVPMPPSARHALTAQFRVRKALSA